MLFFIFAFFFCLFFIFVLSRNCVLRLRPRPQIENREKKHQSEFRHFAFVEAARTVRLIQGRGAETSIHVNLRSQLNCRKIV